MKKNIEGTKTLTMDFSAAIRAKILALRGAKESRTGNTVPLVDIVREAIDQMYEREIKKETTK